MINNIKYFVFKGTIEWPIKSDKDVKNFFPRIDSFPKFKTICIILVGHSHLPAIHCIISIEQGQNNVSLIPVYGYMHYIL